jgi:hypothetical protein
MNFRLFRAITLVLFFISTLVPLNEADAQFGFRRSSKKTKVDASKAKLAAVQSKIDAHRDACKKYGTEVSKTCDSLLKFCAENVRTSQPDSGQQRDMKRCVRRLEENLVPFAEMEKQCASSEDCKSELSKLLSAHTHPYSLSRKLKKGLAAFEQNYGVCFSKAIIEECIAVRLSPGLQTSCGASRSDGGPRWHQPKEMKTWIGAWSSMPTSCKKVDTFLSTHKACLTTAHGDSYYKVTAAAIKKKFPELTGEKAKFLKDGCDVWPQSGKRCHECVASYGKEWQGKINLATDAIQQSEEQIKLSIEESKQSIKSGNYASGAEKVYSAYNTAKNTITSINSAIASNATVPKPAKIDGLKVLQPVAEKRVAELKSQWLEVLSKVKCPKGKNRNKSLEKKLKKVAQDFAKNKLSGKDRQWAVVQIKMNGKKYKVRTATTIEEKAPTVVCMKLGHKKEEPACESTEITWDREKPIRGGKWSAWRFDGISNTRALTCKNVKK